MIVRHPSTGKYLAVDEGPKRGWWIPGGGVDSGENFRAGAIRECKEEAGIDIELKGVLKIQHYPFQGDEAKIRVIFYAEPIDLNQAPKSVPDDESIGAEWVTL